jgi:uncharacterized protein
MPKENLLPSRVDPFRFAENETHLQGKLLIKEMTRLCSNLSNDAGEVVVSMVFGVDEQGISFVQGEYSTHLTVQCQRCMEPLGYDISGNFLSGIVRTEDEAEQLPKGYDSVIAEEGMLVIQDVIEDELIISLPVVPMHSVSDCKIKLPFAIDSGEMTESSKETPFKVIELLRHKHNSNK